VGQVGYGLANFTARFTTTRVYKILSDLGYLKLRYPQDNLLGVRYEPWHIKLKT
jgi:LAS superfamily LD-carboxypeptidase LdcB